MLHFPGLCLISFWVCLFCGARGIVHLIFTGLYCYPRNVLADAKLETNFMFSSVPFRAWKDRNKVWWFVIREPGSHKETELMNQIAQNGKEMENVQQMLPGWSPSPRKPTAKLIGLRTIAVCTHARARMRTLTLIARPACLPFYSIAISLGFETDNCGHKGLICQAIWSHGCHPACLVCLQMALAGFNTIGKHKVCNFSPQPIGRGCLSVPGCWNGNVVLTFWKCSSCLQTGNPMCGWEREPINTAVRSTRSASAKHVGLFPLAGKQCSCLII